MIERRRTKKIRVGDIYIGGDSPIIVQSMTNTDTRDASETVRQIKELEEVGCELIRAAVPDMEAARVLGEIKENINIPLVADIHFQSDLALEAMKQGVDKVRINPGNIGSEEKIKQVIEKAKEKDVPIRIGVNAGSLEKEILEQHNGEATAEAMVDSALKHINILEKYDFEKILVSLKASDIERTVEAYRLLSQKVDYPLHIGVTEAGTKFRGTIMSSIGLGVLLYEGIGDTLRVSLTGDCREEIKVGFEILRSLDLRKKGITVTSCPTCGRTEIDLIGLAERVEDEMQKIEKDKDIHVAVMGCIVNGPGEAKEADLAIIGGKGQGLIMKKGEIVKKVAEDKLLEEFIREVRKY
jgi:(E)-4-hydroxy-3-methylbut-2-enyl-diphosphate synthase